MVLPMAAMGAVPSTVASKHSTEVLLLPTVVHQEHSAPTVRSVLQAVSVHSVPMISSVKVCNVAEMASVRSATPIWIVPADTVVLMATAATQSMHSAATV